MKFTYKTNGTCAHEIQFEINNDIITNIKFVGGCNGNLKAISKLVDGWTVEQIEEKLKGNTCGWRQTSCADQLALAVRAAKEQYSSQNTNF